MTDSEWVCLGLGVVVACMFAFDAHRRWRQQQTTQTTRKANRGDRE